ncbi:MAG: hypothetical protein U0R64_01695 [Candidatus Nanopelagicales bacterium]
MALFCAEDPSALSVPLAHSTPAGGVPDADELEPELLLEHADSASMPTAAIAAA